jgi:hypothetical protein
MGRFLRLSGGVARSFDEASVLPSIYDQEVVFVSNLTTGSSYTIPGGQTYNSSELQIYLNGQVLAPTTDYAYISTPPRTQVSFTFDILIGDRVRFYIGRNF